MMKKIILIIILLFIVSGAILLSSSSLLEIPVLSNIFYREKIADLGVETYPEAVESFSQKLGFTPLGIAMGTIMPEPKTIRVTDVETTSWVNAMCQEFLDMFPLKDFQVKFENGKFKSSAHIFEPIKADVAVFGSVSKRDGVSVDLEFEKVYIGNLPAPEKIRKMLENAAEEHINERLDKLAGFRIDKIQILDGEALFIGILPCWPFGEKRKGDDYRIMW